jgi:hypothetical protein
MISIYLKAEVVEEAQCRCATADVRTGSHIRQVLEDAKALGQKLECAIQFEFNGHLGWIGPTDDVDEQMKFLLRLWGGEE